MTITRRARVTETQTYFIEFEVPEGADDEQIEFLSHEEWGANPGRKPDDYECVIELE